MKKRKRVTRRRVQKKARKKVQKKAHKKISRLQASAGGGMRPIPPLPEWPGYYRPIKKAITLRVDADVLAWFQRQGRGYQTRINRALRKLMMDERKRSGE